MRLTRDCLAAFEEEAARAPDGAAPIAAMRGRYPDLGLALEIGAKVARGGMGQG